MSHEQISVHKAVKQENPVDSGWNKSRLNEIIDRLKKDDDLQSIMETFKGFKESFKELDTIDCSDGRVLKGHKMGIAGSGLLLSPEERVAFITRFKGKIKEVTTHSDCGAAALKFNSLKPEEVPAGVGTADEYGTWCGKKLAEDLGAQHSFLERKDMASEYHNETALVIDQTGKFDSTNLDGFPEHFVCTGAGLGFSEGYMQSEAETLAVIAMGHHGFGDRFSANDPFYIIVSAENQKELDRWQEVAKKAAARFGDRVSVKGFIRPEEKE